MSRTFAPIIVLSLLGSTALAPVAMAQDAGSQAQDCPALGTLIDENRDDLRPEWINQADDVIATNSTAQCAELYQQASAALEPDPNRVQDEDAAQQAAQIIVTQPDPNVSVEQEAPEVAVSQGQPNVSIDQGQPEILVRQQSPAVSVQMPQPVITIDQPQPEIIIRMPDPRVAVSNPQPQVEVRQGEPTVSVQQVEPQVSVRGNQGDDANVDIQQGDPNVQLQTAEGEPQVDLQRQEPQVSFEAADPTIDVQPMGEPEIRFSQSGEPTVRFEELDADGQQTAQAGQQVDEDLQTGSVQQDQAQAQSDDQILARLMSNGQPVAEGEPLEYTANELIDRELVNQEGVSLGTIQMLVEADGQDYVLLGTESVLSNGEQRVVLPLANVHVEGNQPILRGLSEDEYAALQQYDGENAQEIAADQTIVLATL